MRRDTVLVRPDGHIVLRFRADNPGVWLFHCHIEWHVASGLSITLIESPLELQKTLSFSSSANDIPNLESNTSAQHIIPQSHVQACALTSPVTPITGNAAGNTADFLNLKGEPAPPGRLPAGFETKGIVALVFSCVAAFLGIGVIGLYGLKPLSSEEEEAETDSGGVLGSRAE